MQAGECPAQIAKILDVNRSTVTREIERNSVDGKYLYEKAEMLAQGRQHEAHVHYRYGQQLWDEIGGMIRPGVSPEQVCGRLRKLGREKCRRTRRRHYQSVEAFKKTGSPPHNNL